MKTALKEATKSFIRRSGVAGLVTNGFHWLYVQSGAWLENKFLGYPIYQCPFDLQLYQELIFRLRPAIILQTGIAEGGSLLYFASLMDLIGSPANALVFGVDIRLTDRAKTLAHARIRVFEGNSTDMQVIDGIKSALKGQTGIVVLDSNHTKAHVLREIALYKQFVALGSYLVVEDTNLNGHPVLSSFGPGPMEAVDEFLQSDNSFAMDDELWKRNGFSFHQHGWLRRIR